MTTDKLIEVLKYYDGQLAHHLPSQLTAGMYDGSVEIAADDMKRHLRWMIDRCLTAFIPSGMIDDLMKAHRWLGYVQGEMRAMGKYTVNQMREHSRSL